MKWIRLESPATQSEFEGGAGRPISANSRKSPSRSWLERWADASLRRLGRTSGAGTRRSTLNPSAAHTRASERFSERILGSRAALTLAVILAGWPVIRWYLARLQDGADEPMGLLALVAALVFAPRRGWGEPVADSRLLALTYVLAGYILGFLFLPPLGRALLWVMAFGWVAAPIGFAWAWSALLVLSLPFVATLQFYLGYPLRCVTTQVAAWVLRCGGIAARPEATVLHWAGERVLIDAPCSGIQMLWTLLLVAAVLANLRQWNGRATFRIFRFASLAVFLANTLRAVALFCIELRLWPSPPFAHETVGLAMFALAGGALLWRADRMAGPLAASALHA